MPGFPTKNGKAVGPFGAALNAPAGCHNITRSLNVGNFMRGQIIWHNNDDIPVGGSEPRTDGLAAAF